MGRSSHWVICRFCGRKFDFEKAGGAYDGNRYICKSCSKKVMPSQSLNADITYSLKEESWFKRNWKFIIGVLFLIVGFGRIGEDGQTAISGIIIGVVLTVAHFFPLINATRQKKVEKDAEIMLTARESELTAKEKAFQAKAEELKRCKSCGATSRGTLCEYCGSLLD